MRKIVLIAHDPGGYDVINPIFNKLYSQNNIDIDLFCFGPAASLNINYAVSEENIISTIKEYIKQKSLALLVTGTSWDSTLEIEIIGLCKNSGIITYSILDYWSNYRNRFLSREGQYIFPNHLIVMDDTAFKEAVASGIPSEIMLILGHPGIDKYLKNDKKFYKKAKNKRRILFLSQPIAKAFGSQLGFTEKTVLEDLIKLRFEHNFDLRIKFHPKDDSMWKRKFLELEEKEELESLIDKYDLLIGMNTVALLYSFVMGGNIVSYQPSLKSKDICITNKLGITEGVFSFDELSNKIKNNEFNRVSDKKINLLNEKYVWMDGKSTDRISSFILESMTNKLKGVDNCEFGQ